MSGWTMTQRVCYHLLVRHATVFRAREIRPHSFSCRAECRDVPDAVDGGCDGSSLVRIVCVTMISAIDPKGYVCASIEFSCGS